jgi:hypothetical protein
MLPLAASAKDARCPDKGICIDAADGGVTGETRYRRYDAVEVVVYNLNPVCCRYRLSTAEEELGTSVAAGFIGAFFPNLSYGDQTKPTGASSEVEAVAAGILAHRESSMASMLRLSPADQLRVAMLTANRLQVQVEIATAVYNEQLKRLRRADLGEDGVRRAVGKLIGTFQRGASGSTAAPEPGELLDSILRLEELLGKAQDNAPLKKEAEAAVPLLNATLVAYQKAYPPMVSATSSMAEIVAQGDRVFTMKRRIARNVIAGRTVTLKLEAAVNDADGNLGTFSTVAEQKISMGYQVMTVSAGLAGSSMKKTQYTAVTSTTKDASGADKSTNLIGIESNSARLLPMIQLNADLLDFGSANFPVSLNAALGVTGKVDNQGTDVEFLLGPSFGFLGNNLFVTVGAYGGRQQVLQNGLSVGSTIPSTTVPVGKNLQWGFGWSLTWKIK